MASVRSTIELVITGATRGLGAAAAEARAMAERIAAAEDRVSEARTRSAAAEDNVRVAEERLGSARAGHEAALSRIGVAETNLDRVRASSNESTTRLARAQADLDAVRSRSGASAEEIARAESRVNQVRTQSDLASRRLQAAESQLATARANAGRSSSAVAAAEAAIHRARSDAVRASEDLARRESDLSAIRRRGNDDLDRQRSGILGVFDAFGRLADAFSGADGASTSFLSKMSALNSVFSSIGGPIIQTVVGIAQIVAILGAAGEIIGVVGGLIGQVLGGGIPVLVALGLAAGTVALGMDGIKKAAQAAAPAFDKLKASVSDTFQRTLTPAFRDIAAALPKLTAGFNDVAFSISTIATRAVGFLTSAHGIDLLNASLAGTTNLIQNLAPGITRFIQGLLEATASATTGLADVGTAISNVFTRIGDVLTRLAGDGTVNKAVQGLASTLDGLGAVAASLIDLFIQMGAALGNSFGSAMTDLSKTIETSIPFFVHLAQVAGDILVSAFQQLGPAIRDVIVQLLPGANQGLDGFANTIKTVVLPAIADFIRNIPGMIEAIKQFFLSATANALSFASTFLGAISTILGVLHAFFATMALLPGPMQDSFIKAAAATDGFKTKVDELKGSVDGLHDKTVKAEVQTAGQPGVVDMKNQIALINSKKVDVTATPVGTPGVVDMHNQIALVNSKKVDVTAAVPDTPKIVDMHNQIALTNSKKVDVTARVPDTPKVVDMKNQIALTNSKKVDVTANVTGTSAVQALRDAIGAVKDKVVHIVANVTRALGLASGGPAQSGQTYLVGEKGPELLTLGRTNGFVTPAHKTRQLLSGATKGVHKSTDGVGTSRGFATTGGDQPITVNVMLSQEQIAGIAQVEIARRDRATKRTVLAGSGVTF